MFDWCKFEPITLWSDFVFMLAFVIYFTACSFLLEKLFRAIKKRKRQ